MLIHKKSKHVVLNLKDPDRVTNFISSARAFNYNGHNLVAVPHRIEETKILRNLGFEVPSPMSYYYDWPGLYPPYAHQRTTAEFLVQHPRSFCLNGMGSGKTLSVLWAIDYLRKTKRIRKTLIAAPLSTLERTWGDEIFRNFTTTRFAVVHGPREKRLKLTALDVDIFIINHDGLKCKDTMQALVDRGDIDLVVLDESAVFRNAKTERYRALQKFVVNMPYLWALTGTPTPNAPTDAWAQCRLVNPGSVPSYFDKFRRSVMEQNGPYAWRILPTATDVVHKSMQPSIRFATKDCIDLPETIYVTREVALEPEQEKAYRAMLSTLSAEVNGKQVSAVNEAVKLGKLLQILVGSVYDKEGEDVVVPAKARVDLVREIIQESESKAIVFVPYTSALEALAAELRKEFAVEVIHGGTSKSNRDRIFGEFQKHPVVPRVLVANPAAMSHGLTLTAASTIIWFGPTHSNEVFEQANARIVRPGQKLRTVIVQIEATSTERRIFERLRKKGSTQGLLLDLVSEATKTVRKKL